MELQCQKFQITKEGNAGHCHTCTPDQCYWSNWSVNSFFTCLQWEKKLLPPSKQTHCFLQESSALKNKKTKTQELHNVLMCCPSTQTFRKLAPAWLHLKSTALDLKNTDFKKSRENTGIILYVYSGCLKCLFIFAFLVTNIVACGICSVHLWWITTFKENLTGYSKK